MFHRRVEINPRDLNRSPNYDGEKDTVTLGFSIKPPIFIKPLSDPDFLDKAAERVKPHSGIDNITIDSIGLLSTHGRFDTFGMNTEHVVRLRESIVADAKMVFEAALGTEVEVVITDIER